MATPDYPYLCRFTHDEAARQHEEALWEQSFRENVCCARAIEKALRACERENAPVPADCAARVLEDYGHKRVAFVLAHTILDMDKVPALRQMIEPDVRAWADGFHVPLDTAYGRYYCVDTAAVLLNGFVHRTQEAFQKLDLFGQAHCSAGMYDGNVEGAVIVLSPDALKEGAWSPRNQLWLATGGFGCDPKASGRAIYATCLGDGEEARWNREDFCGVLDERYLPEWAEEKLPALRASEQSTQVLGCMAMG